MLAPEAIKLTEETVRDLHAQGQDARAQAVEAVLEVAATALTSQRRGRPPEYFTAAQLARALGLPRRLIEDRIRTGELDAVQVGNQTLVYREAVQAYYDRLRGQREQQPEPHTPTGQELEARRQLHEALVAALPEDRMRRLEELHQRLEEERLTQTERKELIALEREITSAAALALRDRIRQYRAAKS